MAVLLATTLAPADQLAWREALTQELPGETFVDLHDTASGARIDVAVVVNPPAGCLAGLSDLRLI